jgi:peptide deformylase
MKLPLAYYGNPILRKKGEPIKEITSEIKKLVNDMIETVSDLNGLGLAAPQVHKSLLLFIICVPIQGPDEDTWLPGKLHVFINPKIIEYSEERSCYSEGCLSIPGLYEDVERPIKVKVRALGLDGKEFEEEFEGLEAHAVMHENDHINGVLFIDRLDKASKKRIESRLREIKNKYSPKKA